MQHHHQHQQPNLAQPKTAPSNIVSRTTPQYSDSSSEGAYGVGAGVTVAEGHGFWINNLKAGGPAEAGGLQKVQHAPPPSPATFLVLLPCPTLPLYPSCSP